MTSLQENSVPALSSSNNLQETPRKHEEGFSEATNCFDAVACEGETGKWIVKGLVYQNI